MIIMSLQSILGLVSACVTILLLTTPQILSAGYEEGHAAASRGQYSIAVTEFQKASERGDGRAQYSLAVMYYDGIGVKKNRDEAIRLFRKAAANGHPLAKEVLKKIQINNKKD